MSLPTPDIDLMPSERDALTRSQFDDLMPSEMDELMPSELDEIMPSQRPSAFGPQNPIKIPKAIKLDPLQAAQMQSMAAGKGADPENAGASMGDFVLGRGPSDFIATVASNPVGFIKGLPAAANAAVEDIASGIGNLPAIGYRDLPDGLRPYVKPLLQALTSPQYAEEAEPGNIAVFDTSNPDAPMSRPKPLPFQPGVPVWTPHGTVEQPHGNSLEQFISNLTTPGSLATLPFAEWKPVQTYFLSQTVPGAIDATKKLVSPNLSPDERRAAAADVLLNTLFSIGLGHGLAQEIPVKATEPGLPVVPTVDALEGFMPAPDAKQFLPSPNFVPANADDLNAQVKALQDYVRKYLPTEEQPTVTAPSDDELAERVIRSVFPKEGQPLLRPAHPAIASAEDILPWMSSESLPDETPAETGALPGLKNIAAARPPVIAFTQSPANLVLAYLDEKPRGLNAQWVGANIGDLQAGLPGSPELRIVQSVRDLPEQEQNEIAAKAPPGSRVQGMFSRGVAWLIADHLPDLDTARKIYLEETLGHAGMQPLVKPAEIDSLYQLIWRGAPTEAAEIARTYGHDLATPEGRTDFVGEFVAKASSWYLEHPGLWQRVTDFLYNIASRVGWLRNLAPSQVLHAQMRGLTRRAAIRLNDPVASDAVRRSYADDQISSQSAAGHHPALSAQFSLAPKNNRPKNSLQAPQGRGTVLKPARKRASAYSVAFETKIAKKGIGTLESHFASANRNLAAATEKDSGLAKIMNNLDIRKPDRIDRSPANWSWHHVPNRPGILQLVPRIQHRGSAWHHLFHKNQVGGFKIWGSNY